MSEGAISYRDQEVTDSDPGRVWLNDLATRGEGTLGHIGQNDWAAWMTLKRELMGESNTLHPKFTYILRDFHTYFPNVKTGSSCMAAVRALIDRASAEEIRRNTGNGAQTADEPFSLTELSQIAILLFIAGEDPPNGYSDFDPRLQDFMSVMQAHLPHRTTNQLDDAINTYHAEIAQIYSVIIQHVRDAGKEHLLPFLSDDPIAAQTALDDLDRLGRFAFLEESDGSGGSSEVVWSSDLGTVCKRV